MKCGDCYLASRCFEQRGIRTSFKDYKAVVEQAKRDIAGLNRKGEANDSKGLIQNDDRSRFRHKPDADGVQH